MKRTSAIVISTIVLAGCSTGSGYRTAATSITPAHGQTAQQQALAAGLLEQRRHPGLLDLDVDTPVRPDVEGEADPLGRPGVRLGRGLFLRGGGRLRRQGRCLVHGRASRCQGGGKAPAA